MALRQLRLIDSMDILLFRHRARLVMGLVGVIFFLVLWRLFSLQVLQGKDFREQASERYTALGGETNDRGAIYFTDRFGTRFTAGSMQQVYTVAVVPKEVLDHTKFWNEISTIIPNLDQLAVMETLSKVEDPYEIIAKQLPKDVADTVRARKISGVRITADLRRYYPGRDLAAHVVGIVSYQGDELAGRYGLERSFQDVLVRSYADLYSNFFAQLFSGTKQSLRKDFAERKQRGGDVITSIEPEVQLFVQQQMIEMNERWSPQEIGAIVLEPKTGKIIAMAAYPTFDVNEFGKVPDTRVLSNPLVQSSYEMGSVVKPLIVAYALESKAISPRTSYEDKGSVVVADRTIYNFDKRGRGVVEIKTILQQSLNTGMVFIMQKLDRSKVRDYLVRIGLGQKTGVDLPYEAKGIAGNIDRLRSVEYANISFGQGIAWTPIQMARALSVLANYGEMVTPHVVTAIDYGDGFVEPIVQPKPIRVLEPNAVEQVTNMLVYAADTNFGEGGSLFKHYTVASKTGTAQIPNPAGGYYGDRNLHSFFGYFPAYEPKYTVFLYMVHPKGARYSSETLSKPFIAIVDFMLNYYNIPPDRGIMVE
jgi:cell division protein FtsI/penicillin-binding protein 2